jgi:DNA-binding MurR/RpiR family transcriptional regulator
MTARDFILERFQTLSPALQTAARFVVDHPNEVVTCSMRMLAANAHVQPATLVRLAQQLGYAGWPALKAAFVGDLGLASKGYGQRARSLAARRRQGSGLGQEMFAAQRANLVATEARCSEGLRAAASLIGAGKSVYVAGFRASLPVAFTFYYGCRLFHDAVYLVDGQGGGVEAQLRPLVRHDVVVVVGFAPYSRESLQVLQQAQTVGAKVLALTDSGASPLALGATSALLFATESPSFFPSVAAAVAVTEALLEQLVADGGRGVAQRITRAEKLLQDTGAYLPRPPQ